MKGRIKEHRSKPDAPSSSVPLENGWIAELLAREAEQASGHLQRAFKRAARAAFLWPQEAAELHSKGAPLTQLPGIGPYLARIVRSWIEQPPPKPEAPPLRENFITLAQARKILGRVPGWQRKYRGDLQMHTTWSDGAGTIEEMAQAAQARGYDYIGITDHSKGLKIAGGINEEQLLEQGEEIERINWNLKSQGRVFRVLRSIELNLNPRGEADLDRKVMAKLDLVVGSFHSRLREQEDQTSRYLAAVQNPSVHILGHPRGRIYNHRLGLGCDWGRVFACAARVDKAVEIDAYPDRQDLDIRLLRLARQEGVRIAIDTDAHAPEQLGFVELGLAAALMSHIPEDRILNFMPAEALLAWSRGG
jgi:histidinol phosphatase-like PHP family hydrolase